MEITEVRICAVDDGELQAHVTSTLDKCFVIRDLKIIRGSDGHFVDMPNKLLRNGKRLEIASTVTAATRTMLEDKVFAEYTKHTEQTLVRRKLKD